MANGGKAVVLGADDVGAVVVDCGSWAVRFGPAGDDSPRVLVPAAAGARKTGGGRLLAGDALTQAPLATSDISAVHSFDAVTGTASIRDWDAMRAVWDAAYGALRLEPTAAPLLVVEPSRAWPDTQRARALEIAIEAVAAPAAYIARGSAMAAFAAARTTACVVDVGHQGATAVPVTEGYALQKATQISAVGGHFLSAKLAEWTDQRLREREGAAKGAAQAPDGDAVMKTDGDTEMKDAPPAAPPPPAPPAPPAPPETPPARAGAAGHVGRLRAQHEIRHVRSTGAVEDLTGTPALSGVSEAHRTFFRMRVIDDMKACLYRVDSGVAGATTENGVPERVTEYSLPDGQKIDLKEDGGTALANVLFENHPTDKSQCAISNLAYDAVSACDTDCRRELFGGVVLTGGTSLIPGTIERFTRELAVLTPQPYKLKVIGSQSSVERTSGPWIGGSIVASLGTFQNAWVSKKDYEELGAHNSLRKCP